MIKILTYSLLVIFLTPFCSQKKDTKQSMEQLNQTDTVIYENLGKAEKIKANSVEPVNLQEEELILNLNELQGIWRSGNDINMSFFINVVSGNKILAANCLEGACENYEETGDEYLFFCESFIGFSDKIDSTLNVEDLKNSGKYLVTIGKTFADDIAFDDSFEYSFESKYLKTATSGCGSIMYDDDDSIMKVGFFKYDTIPSDLRRSLIKLSEKEGRDYIKEYGL